MLYYKITAFRTYKMKTHVIIKSIQKYINILFSVGLTSLLEDHGDLNSIRFRLLVFIDAPPEFN